MRKKKGKETFGCVPCSSEGRSSSGFSAAARTIISKTRRARLLACARVDASVNLPPNCRGPARPVILVLSDATSGEAPKPCWRPPRPVEASLLPPNSSEGDTYVKLLSSGGTTDCDSAGPLGSAAAGANSSIGDCLVGCDVVLTIEARSVAMVGRVSVLESLLEARLEAAGANDWRQNRRIYR